MEKNNVVAAQLYTEVALPQVDERQLELFEPSPILPLTAVEAQIIEFRLPDWSQKIRARAGTERVLLLDGRPVQFECVFPNRIPLEIEL